MDMISPVGMFANATGEFTTVENGRLDKTDFLALLVAELRYQDPLDPMDSTEMTAQLAQFSQLEQSLSMNEALTQLQTTALLGRTVTTTGLDGNPIEGKVVRVYLNNDVPMLELDNGMILALQDIQQVSY